MFNSALVRVRLGQYGAAWLISFVLGLIAILAGSALAHMRLVEVADLVLPVEFAGLTLWLDGQPLEVGAAVPLNLTAGPHTVTVAVEWAKRSKPLRVELDEVPGSPARVRLVGGK